MANTDLNTKWKKGVEQKPGDSNDWYLEKIKERVQRFATEYSGFGAIQIKIEFRDRRPVRLVYVREEESVMP